MSRTSARALAAARDAGLYRLRSWTRAVLVGGLVATGVATAAVAHALPGRAHAPGTSGSAPSTSSQGSGAQQPTGPAPAPAQAPAPAPAQQPVTVSGGS